MHYDIIKDSRILHGLHGGGGGVVRVAIITMRICACKHAV